MSLLGESRLEKEERAVMFGVFLSRMARLFARR